jgi:hypothetical protein
MRHEFVPSDLKRKQNALLDMYFKYDQCMHPPSLLAGAVEGRDEYHDVQRTG